jgi:hypothetical protein
MMIFQVLLAFEQPIDFLRRNENHRRIPLFELVEGRLKLSQLPLAVRSPGAADKNHHKSPAKIR